MSIALILSLAIVVIVTVLLGAFAVVEMRSEREERWRRLKEDVAMSADQQAVALSLTLWNVDVEPIEAIMRSVMRNREIQAVALVSPLVKKTLARDAQGQVTVSAAPLAPGPAGAGLVSERRSIQRNGQPLGEITVVASSRFLEQELDSRRLSFAAMVAGLDGALVLSLYLLLWRLLLRPLKSLERLAADVTQGGSTRGDAAARGRFLGELSALRQSLLDMLAMLDRRYQALRESEDRLKLATTAGNIGIWDWDVTRDELVWDDQMYRQYGVRREDFSAAYEAWAGTLTPEDFDSATQALKAALAGEAEFAAEFKIRRSDGESRFIKAAATTVRDPLGRPLRMVGVSLDITDRRAAEDAIRTVNMELERRVGERTLQLTNTMAELTVARDKAESATRTKSEFLANMSHEIRTPMNAIVGMTDLALRTEMTDRQRGYLTKVRSAAGSLLVIIDDILDFSKIEAGKLEIEARPFSLRGVLDAVTHVVGLKASEKGLELLLRIAPGVPDEVLGDALRLKQVLINLCSNAVKFTARGEVLVEVESLPVSTRHQVQLRFSVRDTGIGIDEEHMGHLFQAFNQLDASTTRQYGGTGLGLAISQRLVELMGGTIAVTSTPGQGSDFHFSASLGLEEPGAAALESTPERAGPVLRGLRVLVVDDNASSRLILGDLLSEQGVTPTLVDSGQQALQRIARADPPFDLVLVDWKMPGLDGLETGRQLRAQRPHASPPRLVLLTAYGDEALARSAVRKGFAASLEKPVSSRTLRATLLALAMDEPSFERIESSRDTARPAEAPAVLAGRRVLLAEDNEFNQIVATELLRDVAGMRLSLAHNGQEALDCLRTEEFDIVLMDVQMPVMDGYETTAVIRRRPELAGLPIIAMTAHAMLRERQKCLDAGMNDHLTKPVDPSELFAVLAKWLPVTAEAADGRPGEPTVSFELGLRRCLGKPDLYDKIAGRFLATQSNLAEELDAALAGTDRRRPVMLAHTLISTAALLGADRMSQMARELQQALETEQAGETSRLTGLLRREHQAVVHLLQQRFEDAARTAS